MLDPVSLKLNSGINFRGEHEDLINSPGKYAQQPVAEQKPDEFVAQQDIEEKSGSSVGKKIGKAVLGLLILSGAAFGLYKWKGVNGTWLNKEAKGTLAKVKNWAVKPGEWLDKNIVQKISEKLSNIKFRNKNAEDVVEDVLEAST